MASLASTLVALHAIDRLRCQVFAKSKTSTQYPPSTIMHGIGKSACRMSNSLSKDQTHFQRLLAIDACMLQAQCTHSSSRDLISESPNQLASPSHPTESATMSCRRACSFIFTILIRVFFFSAVAYALLLSYPQVVLNLSFFGGRGFELFRMITGQLPPWTDSRIWQAAEQWQKPGDIIVSGLPFQSLKLVQSLVINHT